MSFYRKSILHWLFYVQNSSSNVEFILPANPALDIFVIRTRNYQVSRQICFYTHILVVYSQYVFHWHSTIRDPGSYTMSIFWPQTKLNKSIWKLRSILDALGLFLNQFNKRDTKYYRMPPKIRWLSSQKAWWCLIWHQLQPGLFVYM